MAQLENCPHLADNSMHDKILKEQKENFFFTSEGHRSCTVALTESTWVGLSTQLVLVELS